MKKSDQTTVFGWTVVHPDFVPQPWQIVNGCRGIPVEQVLPAHTCKNQVFNIAEWDLQALENPGRVRKCFFAEGRYRAETKHQGTQIQKRSRPPREDGSVMKRME